jgi:hypothetical protein
MAVIASPHSDDRDRAALLEAIAAFHLAREMAWETEVNSPLWNVYFFATVGSRDAIAWWLLSVDGLAGVW